MLIETEKKITLYKIDNVQDKDKRAIIGRSKREKKTHKPISSFLSSLLNTVELYTDIDFLGAFQFIVDCMYSFSLFIFICSSLVGLFFVVFFFFVYKKKRNIIVSSYFSLARLLFSKRTAFNALL